MASDQPNPQDGPRGPDFRELVDSVFGWNVRFGRTLVDSFVRPATVAGAALVNDHARYAGPLRLFVFLFSALLALSALTSGGSMTSIESHMPTATDADYEAWLSGSGVTLDDINDSLSFWLGILVWPITILASAPYIVLFKAYAPRRTFYGHTLVYLMTTNASMAVQIALVLALGPFVDIGSAAVISTIAMALVYFYVSGRVVFSLYASSVLGGALKVFGLIVLTPIALLLTGVLQFFAIVAVIEMTHGLSLFDLMVIQSGAAS